MLQRVGLALSRLLKPINITHANLSRTLMQNGGGRKQNASSQDGKSDEEKHEKKKEEPSSPAGFQRFSKDSKEAAAELKETDLENEPEHLVRENQGAVPGLTTTFLSLLRQLQEKRKSISFGFGLRGYQDGQAVQKKSTKVRKGMVINDSVE